jgi:hypothetical protein
MKPLIYIVACLFSITGYAQTKLISFRSHSGNNANFRAAAENDLCDMGNSNFGIIEYENIDSVILVSKNRIIIVRRHHGKGSQKPRRDTLTRTNANNFFTATSVEGLKDLIQTKYHPASIHKTIFIGFDNKFKNSNGSPKK